MQKNNLNIDTCIDFLKTVSLNVVRDKWRKNKWRGIALNIDDLRQEETSINVILDEMGIEE